MLRYYRAVLRFVDARRRALLHHLVIRRRREQIFARNSRSVSRHSYPVSRHVLARVVNPLLRRVISKDAVLKAAKVVVHRVVGRIVDDRESGIGTADGESGRTRRTSLWGSMLPQLWLDEKRITSGIPVSGHWRNPGNRETFLLFAVCHVINNRNFRLLWSAPDGLFGDRVRFEIGRSRARRIAQSLVTLTSEGVFDRLFE